jgi:hypothetical protein
VARTAVTPPKPKAKTFNQPGGLSMKTAADLGSKRAAEAAARKEAGLADEVFISFSAGTASFV